MTSEAPNNSPVEKVLSIGHYGMLTLRRIMVARLDAEGMGNQPKESKIRFTAEAIHKKIAEVIGAEMELAAYILFVAEGMELPPAVAEQVRGLAEKYPEGMQFDMQIPMEMAWEIVNGTKKAYETSLASVREIRHDPATDTVTLDYGFPPVQELFQAYAQEWLRRQGDPRPILG